MSGYIGPIPVPQATQTRETFTATASQTTFNTSGYTPGYLDVFINGVKLAAEDYTATNGSDVVLASGAAVNDIVDVVAYQAFEISSNVDEHLNVSSATSGQYLSWNGSDYNWAAATGGGSGVTTYSAIDDLPLTGNSAGDMAYVSGNNRLYINNGTGWYNIALVNTNPSITSVQDASSNTTPFTLATDGSATVITITASDPEEIPLTYSYSVTSGSLTNGGGTTATVTQGTGSNTNVFTVTPTTTEAYAGSFTLTFTASDGINQGTSANSFALQFSIENSKYTALLLRADASSSDNQTDASSNNLTVTGYGDITSTAFTPYHPKGYSTYFDGLNDFLSIADSSSLELGSSDFTWEAWIKTASTAQFTTLIARSTAAFGAGMWQILFNQSSSSSGNVALYMGDHSTTTPVVATSGTSVIDNEWHHIAVVRSGSSFTIYIDGTSAGTGTSSASVTDISGAIWVGDDGYYAGRDYKGYMKDVRMVIGTAVYTSTFTPPTAPLSAITNTQLLTCHLPYIADGSTNEHSITVVGTTESKQFSPYDQSGSYSKSSHGGSVYFDGTGDYLVTSSSTNIQLGTGDFTVECWFYCTSASSYHQLFSYRSSNGSYAGKGSLALNPNNGYIWYETSGIINTSSNWVTNQWYHLALVRSGSTLKIYQNGVEVGSASHSTNLDGTTLSIAGNNDGSEGFAGYISDLRLVKGTAVYTSDFTPPTSPLSAITNTQLLTCTNKHEVWDAASGRIITLNGDTTASTTRTKYDTSSIYLDGTGDYIDLPSGTFHVGSSEDYTIEGWVNFESISSDQGIFQVAGLGNTLSLILIYWNGWQIYIDGTNYSDTTASTPSTNTWYHLAVVRNSGTITVYLDGTAIRSVSSNTTSFDNQSFTLGGYVSTSYLSNAYFEDWRITKGLARYTANFTPPSSSLEG